MTQWKESVAEIGVQDLRLRFCVSAEEARQLLESGAALKKEEKHFAPVVPEVQSRNTVARQRGTDY